MRIGLFVMAALLVGSLATAFVVHRQATDAEALRHRSVARLMLWQASLEATLNAETGQRGYVIASRADYLKPWQEARSAAEAADASLLDEYRDEPVVVQQIQALRELQRAKFDEMLQVLTARNAGGKMAAEAIVLDDAGSRLMDAIRAAIGRAMATERAKFIGLAQRAEALRVRVLVVQSLALVLVAAWGAFAWRSLARRQSERLQAVKALQRSEQRLRLIADHLPVLISHLDRDFRYTFANVNYQQWFSLREDEIVGRTVADVFGEDVFAGVKAHMQQALAGDAVCFHLTNPIPNSPHNLLVHYIPDRDSSGAVVGLYGLVIDRTEPERALALLEASQRQLRAVTDNLPALITYIDRDERVQFLNATVAQWLHLDVDKTIGLPLCDMLGPVLYEQRCEQLHRALSGERVEFDTESDFDGVNRFLHTVYIPDRRSDGSVQGVFALGSDVTELKRVEAELSKLARLDALTGLPNRRAFEELLAGALARAQRSRRPMALMFLDVDHFKAINDSAGHAVGDAVLKEFAHRVQHNIRATDTAARLAGDEFVVILEDLNALSDARGVAAKLVQAVRAPVSTEEGGPLTISTSVGVAYQTGPQDATVLMGRADRALYKAKAAGRDGYAVDEEDLAPPMPASSAAAVATA